MAPGPNDMSLTMNHTLIDDGLSPERPFPFVMTDKQNTLRWVVSLPRHLDYPLKPSEYADICRQSDDLGKHSSISCYQPGMTILPR